MEVDRVRDAIVFVPGILGSALVDDHSGKQLWGLKDPRWYVDAWFSGKSLDRLVVSDDERAAMLTLDATDSEVSDAISAHRIRAGGVLEFPAAAPVLAGIEPYREIVNRLKRMVIHPDAVLPFAYDWRLSVEHNARLLASAIRRHLESWRAHEAHDGHRSRASAQAVLVAHSMGGLLSRAVCAQTDIRDSVRQVITIGTPFAGSVKALLTLAGEEGVPLPLPRSRLRRLALTLPSMYDLLPRYRAVETAVGARVLTLDDVAGFGGDVTLATAAQRFWARTSSLPLPRHHAIVGADQPTPQSVRIIGDSVQANAYTHRWRVEDDGLERDASGQVQVFDRGGDGTVFRDAATLSEAAVSYVAQQHGYLARSQEVILMVRQLVTDLESLGARLGRGTAGLLVPDLVRVGEEFIVRVSGISDPAAVRFTVEDVSDGDRVVAVPRPHGSASGEQTVWCRTSVQAPGLFRITAKSYGNEALGQTVIAFPTGGIGEPDERG